MRRWGSSTPRCRSPPRPQRPGGSPGPLAAGPPAQLADPFRAGQGERPGLGPPRAARAAHRDGRPLHLGPGRQRLGQLLLLGRRAGRHQELEGHVLRVLGLVQLHHRRQTTGVPVADGDLGPDLRPQLVEHARAAGARGRRDGRTGLPLRAALVQRAGRPPRRSGGGADARGRHDVPLQQPGRAAGAPADRRHLRHHARPGAGADQVDGPGRSAHRVRLHHQDAAGLPDPPRHGRRLPAGRADGVVAPGLADLPHGCLRASSPRAGGWPSWR